MDRWVQNIHGNGIKISAAVTGGGDQHGDQHGDSHGDQRWEKVFPIQKFGFDGKEVSTGYTRITEAEYELCKRDKTFMYFCRLGKLIVHESLPSAAQTPHEAILEARKQIRALQEQLTAAQTENKLLKQRLAVSGEGAESSAAAGKEKPKRREPKKNGTAETGQDGQGGPEKTGGAEGGPDVPDWQGELGW
jgi:hypothetical protein